MRHSHIFFPPRGAKRNKKTQEQPGTRASSAVSQLCCSGDRGLSPKHHQRPTAAVVQEAVHPTRPISRELSTAIACHLAAHISPSLSLLLYIRISSLSVGMGQTSTRHVAEDQAAPAGSVAAVTTLPASSPLPHPPVAPPSLLVPEAEKTSIASAAGDEKATSDMAASSACKVSFRESLAKMRWTASSLEALRAAEDKLLVSDCCHASCSCCCCCAVGVDRGLVVECAEFCRCRLHADTSAAVVVP